MTSASQEAEFPNPPAAPPRVATSGEAAAALGGVTQERSQSVPDSYQLSQNPEHTVAPPSIVTMADSGGTRDYSVPPPTPTHGVPPAPAWTPIAPTDADASALYTEFVHSTFHHPTFGNLPLPTRHPEDGCYYRAHKWTEALQAKGIDVRKVFVGRGLPPLKTMSSNALGATTGNPRPVVWGYHVAPVIAIQSPDGGSPRHVVLDPAMGKGVLDLRRWLELAGVEHGFADQDLNNPKPYRHPLGAHKLVPGEPRVLITDPFAMTPPWLNVTGDGDVRGPASMAAADQLARTVENRMAGYTLEASERQDFRDWVDALPSTENAWFNLANNQLQGDDLADVQDWFRDLSPGAKADFAGKLGDLPTQALNDIPSVREDIEAMRSHLDGLSPERRDMAKDAASYVVDKVHGDLPGGHLREPLLDVVKDLVAYTYDTENLDTAVDQAESLARNFGSPDWWYNHGGDPVGTAFDSIRDTIGTPPPSPSTSGESATTDADAATPVPPAGASNPASAPGIGRTLELRELLGMAGDEPAFPHPPAAPPPAAPPLPGSTPHGTPAETTETGSADKPERSFGSEPEASFTFTPDGTRLGDEQRGTLDSLADVLTNAAETRRQDGYLPPPVTVSGEGAQVIVDALADHGIDAKAEPGRADGADVHVDWSLTRANQDPAEQVLGDESWRHSTAENAQWFDPKAGHVPPQVVENVASSQPVVGQVRGEQGGLRTDGSVWRGPIGYDIRRFDVAHVVPGPDGTPVRVTVPVEHHTTKLHLDPGNTGVDVDALRERVRSGVDEMYNQGYRTAGGRQFHVSVEFTDNPAEAHGVIRVGVPRSSMNQLNWSADASARELGHEVGHFQGMHDEYLGTGEVKPVFNHQDGKGHVTADKGPMTALFEDAGATFKPRNMWLVENRMNALESTAGLPAPPGEFPDPPRAPGEEAAHAAVDAARRRLDAAEGQLAHATGATVPDPRAIAAAENRVAAATSALEAANDRLSSLEYHGWLNDAFGDAESLHDTDDAASLAEQPSPPAPHRGLTDVLPREDWYRLYLDPAHFDLAEALFPHDPGSFYDHDESPGFQASMEAAYERFLDPEKFPEQRLNADVYEQMHDVVNSSLKDKTNWTAQDYEATTFPLRAENPSPDVLTETVAGRPLLVEGGDYLVGGNAVAFIDRTGNRPYITTNYEFKDVKGLVDAVFDQFYDDMANARTDADRFKAIGRAVRTVHIVHPFNDTNRRLNVHLLLPRLLLESGFQPVAFKDMDQLFQGGRSLDQIADALARGQGMDLTGRIRGTDTASIASTDETRPAGGHRELEFPPQTPQKQKKPVVAWAAAEVITGRHLPPPPVGDPGRVVFDDIVDAVALQYQSYGHFHADQLASRLAARPEAVGTSDPGPWTYRVKRALAVVDALSADGKAAHTAAADEVAEIVKRRHRLPEDRNPGNSMFGEIMAVVGLRHLSGGHDSADALAQRLADQLGTGHPPDETGEGRRSGTGSPSPSPSPWSSPAPAPPAPEPRAGTPEPSPEFTTDVPVIEVTPARDVPVIEVTPALDVPVIEVTPAQDVPVIEVTPAEEAFPNPPAAPKRVEFAVPEEIEMGPVPTPPASPETVVPTGGTEQQETGRDLTTGQENPAGDPSVRHNPFADRITAATEAVDGAAQARDDIASTLGPIKVDNTKAQRHVATIEQSTADTRGAVIATEHAFGPNPDRIGQAQRNLTAAAEGLATAREDLDAARNRHEEAADKLAEARENNTDDGIRRWARIERERARDVGTAENDVARADIAHHQAVRDLDHARATEIAMTAARDAHDRATTALETANNAVTTITTAYDTTQAALNDANRAASAANTVRSDLHDAVRRANTADTTVARLTGRIEETNKTITTLTGRRDDLVRQRNEVDAQPVTDENRQDLEAQRTGLNTRIDELDTRIRAQELVAGRLATDARTAGEQYDEAVRAINTDLERIDGHVRDARNAGTAANTGREEAKNAVAAAEAAIAVAEDAAKQGKVERGLTMLSFLPHNSELHIETLGDRDQLIDGLAGASGLPRRDVADQVDAMSDEQVTNAINSGTFGLTTPSGGPVDVTVHVDLHRPADTRTASRHRQPAAIKAESARESSVPVTEATSSTVPIRIPLLFISPLDLAGTVMRPIAYVGVTGKRAQKFESSTTASGSTSTEWTAHVPTRLSLTLSGPGNTDPVASSIDAGLRLPDITRVYPVQVPLPNNDYDGVRTAPAVVPPAFRDLLGNSPDSAKTLGELLLTQDTRPKTVTVDGTDIVVTPAGPARITLAGTTSSTTSHGSSHGSSWQTTRGSDATFGFGLYGGPKSWYVGGFADFSTGLTAASTPGVDDSITQSRTGTDLVYQVDRPMRADQGGTNAQDTVSGMVKVPVSQARDLGLPLPPHLSGSTPGPAGQRYVFGRDDITSVDIDAVENFVAGAFTDTPTGLSDTGRNAIAALFGSQDTARDTVFDALHGGAQAVWTKGGKTHIVDIHAVPVPPARTAPSGQTDTSTEDAHTDKVGRTTSSVRTARAGVGGAYLPVGTDSPNPNAPKTTPEGGNPNPYQGGPTAATAAPRASLALNGEVGIANKSGYSGKDGRAARYAGEMRDYDGSVHFVVVHRTTPAPNWAQRFFLGDRLLFGPSVDSRLSGPAKSDVEQALAGNNSHEDIRTGVVADAIKVTTPADKLGWATKPLPPSTMTPGVYLGTPPPNPNPAIDPGLFGEYTNIEHVRISPNVTEGVEIALAKRIAPAAGAPQGTGQPAPVTRRPPKGSGNWSAWGQSDVTDTRNNPDGSRHVTGYTYKRSDLTRPGTTPGSAVRDFVGRVGSHGTAGQGFGGKPNSTGKMLREGRLSDFNGTLTGKAEYSAPRLVEVRPESTLKRNQAGDQVAGSTRSWGVGLDGEVSGGVIPRRDNGTGALIVGVVGGGGKYGRSDALELTSGGRQTFEYTGPTAFVAMDVRYRYSADMNLRTMFHRSDFADVPVTVDEPDGVLVEMPVAHAIDMFTQLGLPVPPELSALRPAAKAPVSDPAHTLLTGDGYASYSDTSVLEARLTGSLDEIGDRLTELGVTDKEWRAEVTRQVDLLLNSPAGHVWLRDPLTGEQGHGGLISVPDPGPAFEDVVDIRVRTELAADVRPQPTIEKLVPGKQSTADYVTVSRMDQEATTWSLSGAVNVGVRRAEVPATPPGQPDANGVVQQAPPNAGASSGSFTPQVVGGARSWKTESVMDGSGSTKQTTQVETDKVGRDTRQVVHTLEITRRRGPMPAIDTVGLGIPKHLNWDKLGPAAPQAGPGATATGQDSGNPGPRPRPVTLRGEIDLVSPSAQASPPLLRPARAPEFEVVAGPPPNNTPLFGAGDGWRVESIGADTVNAIHDAAYAQLSGDQPTRPRPSARDMADSALVRSEYTRPGSNSEYILHNAVKGTTVHNVSNYVFSGGSHEVGRILGSKHPFYDALFDYRLTGHLHGNLTFDKALPPDTTMNLGKDNETATPKGTTRTVSTSFGPAVTTSGANTHNAAGPAPTNAVFGPPASESIGNDKVTATSSKTGTAEGRKYEGRSYLFVVGRADFYSNVERHGSNWTHRPLTAIKDAFGGRAHRPDSTVKISSFADMKVRVWENTALDKGLLAIGDVWRHGGRLPDNAPYTVTPGTHGATIHPAGHPAPAAGPPVSGPRGRTLHIAPGVSRPDVTAFIGSLPSDMRPATFTVAPGSPFTATDIQVAVRDLPEPTAPEPAGTTTTATGAAETRTPATDVGNRPLVPGDKGKKPVRPPTDAIGMRPPSAPENAGAPVADARQPRGDTGTFGGRAGVGDESPGDHPPVPGRAPEARPGKRSRDAFEADDGPVTTPGPQEVRPVPERLVEPAPEDTAALLDVVTPGRKFTDPATFAGLINPSRYGAGRDVNCVDAALAFHATYHGEPRVAGSAPGGLRSGASAAGEELGYAPELFSRGAAGLREVIARVERAGHGADALVFGFPRDGAGHAWNLVNHNGSVFLVDAQGGTVTPATPDALPWLDRVYAIPLDADGNYVAGAESEPTPPAGSDPYEVAGYERAVAEHRMRAAAAAGEEIPVPGTDGRLVPSLGGLRLVGALVTASVAAELATMSGRDVIALVIGPDAVDDEDDGEPVVAPEVLRFPPRGRPQPVGGQ
ncbi:protein-glutamine glutaminase family protein [Actinophytocola glycyrrhizae]|uniref:Protein-glutamine glutaminase family protein n=2 Tax=Actinophytocola glycyrrhizae TaxID=2044873 RepID=A0ABV9RTE9_9PSEU